MELARIILRRPKQWGDRLRRYRVWIDDAERGSIRAGSSQTFDLPAGRHTLRLSMDWVRSPQLVLDVAPGDSAVVNCGCDVQPRRAVRAIFTKRASWIYLQPAETSPHDGIV